MGAAWMRYLLGGLHRSLTVLADTCGLTRDRVLSLQFRSIRRLCGRQRRASHYRSGGSSSEFIPSGQTEGTSTSKTLRVWPFPQSTDLGRAENTSIFTPHFKERYRIKDHHSRVSSHKQGAAVRTITSSLHPSDDRGIYERVLLPYCWLTLRLLPDDRCWIYHDRLTNSLLNNSMFSLQTITNLCSA